MPKYNRGYIKQDLHDSLLLDKADATDVTTIETALATCTMEDVTASRALGTTYQNTSGKLKMVTVTLAQTGSTGIAISNFYVQATTPASTTLVGSLLFGVSTSVKHALSFWVQPDYYYRASDEDIAPATTTIDRWVEWTFF